MLFETEKFQARFKKPAGWSDHVFRYCDFSEIDTEGGNIDSIFVGCTFNECEWYWGLFNLCICVNVKFENCIFRGTAFSGSKFIECEFKNCEFTKDNLNSECSFNDVAWYNCIQINCKGLEHEFRSRR